jgi:4-carboxymuconolactone decarboxylase
MRVAITEHEDVAAEAFAKGEKVLSQLSPEGAAPPWETLADLAPVLGRQVGHTFGAVMSRPGLDLRTRELATVCMLAAMGGLEPQLTFHVGGALRAGATPTEIVEAVTQVSAYAGLPRALNAIAVVRGVFADAGVIAEAE